MLASVQGAQALHLFPWAPRAPGDTASARRRRRAQKPSDTAPPSSLSAAHFIWRHCRLCGAGCTDVEDVFHVAFVCPQAGLAAARAPIAGSIRHVVRDIWTAVERAHSIAHTRCTGPTGAEHQALTAFLAGGALPPAEYAFMAYRLLMAAPWPADRARQQGFQTAAALGVLFETGRTGHLRHLCTRIVQWADTHLSTVAAAWRTVTAAAA